MSKLDFAIEELKATGWAGLDTAGCAYTTAGRLYPGVDRIKREFAEAGFALTTTRTDLFDCYRAAWSDATGAPVGAVVGQTEAEAAVYALAQLRRSGAKAGA